MEMPLLPGHFPHQETSLHNLLPDRPVTHRHRIQNIHSNDAEHPEIPSGHFPHSQPEILYVLTVRKILHQSLSEKTGQKNDTGFSGSTSAV